ncbi:MAG TPA: tetratricopeptide repeat protein [Desulfobulbus sp.]|nr:tetratricopeptide repeat protein [Desulfobulbus sp.]
MRKNMKRIVSIGLGVLLALTCVPSLFAGKTVSWKELNSKTTGYYTQQKFMKAAGAGREAVAAARKLPAGERAKLAISLGNLAMIYTHLGKFPEAEEPAKEELKIRQDIFGKENPEVITAWNHLAIIYTLAGKLKKVNPDAEQCLLQGEPFWKKPMVKTARKIFRR